MRKAITFFLAGMGTTIFLGQAIHQASHRRGTFGGEVFVPLLIIVLLAVGWEAKGIFQEAKK